MKQHFIASLCRNGLIGGAIIADDEGITYKTGKITVSAGFRNLNMKYADIRNVAKDRFLCFPTVSVTMRNSETFRFLVFGRKRFCSLLESKGIR